MSEKKNLLTYEGLKKLEDELQDLKVVKRKEIAQKIKEAREQGDLSENAEYDAAKDEQRDIEARIEQIEKILKNAEVVVEDEVDLDKISVGCKVKVLDVEFEEEEEFKIVGSSEANSLGQNFSLLPKPHRCQRYCCRKALCPDAEHSRPEVPAQPDVHDRKRLPDADFRRNAYPEP